MKDRLEFEPTHVIWHSIGHMEFVDPTITRQIFVEHYRKCELVRKVIIKTENDENPDVHNFNGFVNRENHLLAAEHLKKLAVIDIRDPYDS